MRDQVIGRIQPFSVVGIRNYRDGAIVLIAHHTSIEVFAGQLATQPLQDAGLDVDQWPDEDPMRRDVLLTKVGRVQGILASITERIDQELLDAAPSLKVVAEYGVGYDNIDVAACSRRGVVVCNTPGVLAETTADLAWALILGAGRRIGEGIEHVKQGRWSAWNPNVLLGQDVHHRTLGIVGLGAIGWQVARRALGLDMP